MVPDQDLSVVVGQKVTVYPFNSPRRCATVLAARRIRNLTGSVTVEVELDDGTTVNGAHVWVEEA
jgi:hypothetical protein